MRVRTYRARMQKALRWYTERLYEFQLPPLSPANLERVKRRLLELQTQQCKCEADGIWRVPVDIVLYNNEMDYSVQLVNENRSVVYLDDE